MMEPKSSHKHKIEQLVEEAHKFKEKGNIEDYFSTLQQAIDYCEIVADTTNKRQQQKEMDESRNRYIREYEHEKMLWISNGNNVTDYSNEPNFGIEFAHLKKMLSKQKPTLEIANCWKSYK